MADGLGAPVLAAFRFKGPHGLSAVIFLIVLILIVAAVVYAVRRRRRGRRGSPPDDWARTPSRRGEG